ncbi:MFS transporter [Brachybacterium sacelli]|uniref:DHA2 family multidrug resistance protein-like MFS transporter n=1 Tax=Brachybacterium sacelli TaxID=173364 RepID=A0ABS4X421_9MICO|nr:MFS transporter [Brachybacterium sacelli]MBP2383081.1 DHA2 family multidrug resistance protein-like MFS transporter [Brachybacterium sacelli]
MTTNGSPHSTSPPTWREWTALLVLALPLFMMATDFTAIFLAMPSIAADLAPSTPQLLWIVHIGELIAAGLVITMGWLTGRIGPRALLLCAMALYAVASALAAFAPDAETLLAARVLIGLATAAASPAGIALLRSLFRSSEHFGIGFAVVMGAFSVGGALGPPLSGLLLEHFWWGAVFLVNVPVAAVALVAGLRLFPRTGERTTDRIDMTSVVISMTSVMLGVYGLQNIADRGLSVPDALAVLSGIALGWWFLRRQRRIDNPLLDLNLFSLGVLRVLAIVFVTSQVAFMAVDFVLVQYLQVVAGIPTATLGLVLAVPATGAIIATALTPALSRRFAPSTVMTAGTGIAVLGTAFLLVCLVASAVTPLLAVGMTFVSFGVSPPMVVGAQLMVTSVTQRQAGPAAAIQDIAASLGAAVGIVLLGSLTMSVFHRMLRAAAPDAVERPAVDAAGESPGGAVALAESLGGTVGQELLLATQVALTRGTIVAYLGALVVGLATMVILRGLRGVDLPAEDGTTARRRS